MPLRRLIMLGFAGLGVALLAVIGGVWWVFGAIGNVWGLGWSMGAVVVLTGTIWVLIDRELAAREFDKNNLPARPEYTKFDLYDHPKHLEELGGRTLKSLTYIVFDTETTGLRPSEGDEIISIAGVRVVDGVIQKGDPFSRLVNPGRDIPKASIRFHGITEDMVEGEDPIAGVLPDFKAFVGDAVLVAHNAAFDIKFLKLKEQVTGVVFDNLVLDSLLLSVFLEEESHNHGLDAIAERMGVVVEGRHTALGDSLVTAGVFLRMLDMLEARGIRTLGQAIEASSRISHIREMQKQF
ncbi:MAG: 3'-5' exonuclease [Rhodospirillales bacterium]|nr:3'-5' exonuclease [Alphaproteobacteria bacterium]MBL6947212.1 3'-5' exonuclease [Rhodospirillales bacterium]